MDNVNKKQTSEKIVLGNSIINLIGWIIPLATMMVTIPIFVKELSTDGFGVWVLVNNLTGYFSLVQLGIGPAVTKFTAEFSFKNESEKITDVFNAAVLFSFIIGSLCGLLIFIISPFLVSILKVPPPIIADSGLAFRLGGLFFPFYLITTVYLAIFMGYQRFDFSNSLNLIRTVLTAVISIFLLYEKFGIVGMVVASFIGNLSLIILGHLMLVRLVRNYRFRLLSSIKTLQSIFSYSIYTFISQIAQLFNSKLAELIIGFTLGPSSVTYFNIPARIVGFFCSGTSTISGVLFPFASELQANGDLHRTKIVFLKSTRYFSFLIVPFYIMFIGNSKFILDFWMTSELSQSSYLIMSIYSIAYLISGMTIVPSLFLQGFGQVKFISKFSLIIIFIAIFSYYPLINIFGLVGAGYAILLTQLTSVFFIFFTLKYFRIKIGDYISYNKIPYIIGLGSFLISTILRAITLKILPENASNWLSLIILFILYLSISLKCTDIGIVIKRNLKPYLEQVNP